ncbi:MAG: hypothetical protein AB1730_08100 [Myxococcota bacterium]
MDVIQQTGTLLHLRATEGFGYGLTLLALGVAAYGVRVARRKPWGKTLAGYAAPIATVMLIPLALYFFVRTIDVELDKAAGQARVREVSVFGLTVRDEAMALDGAHAVLERARRRNGGYGFRVCLEAGATLLPLREGCDDGEASARATLKVVSDFLGVPPEIPFD